MKRYSKNRQAILECLQGTKVHPTAEWVYNRIKPDYPSLSLGTVYRNISQLKEAGLVKSVGVVNGEEHFDGNITPHSHAVCHGCGRIYDLIDGDYLMTLIREIEQNNRFKVSELSLIGLCSECNDSII